jgi:superfamily II DNA helicase RecQ
LEVQKVRAHPDFAGLCCRHKDVLQILGISTCEIFKSSFNRPNIFYEVGTCRALWNLNSEKFAQVRPKNASGAQVVGEIVEFIKGTYPRGSGIVYTFSRNEAEVRLTKEALTDLLVSRLRSI